MSETALSLRHLTKSYRGFRLGPIDLDVEPGRVVALVGPNGAGKTTLMNCVTGLVDRDDGDVALLGTPPRKDRAAWRHGLGHVGEHRAFYQAWTAAQNLRFIGGFYPDWNPDRVSDLARRFRLPLDKRAGALSTGNRTKLAIVAALGHAPSLLLLDEPFSGLDPVIRSEALEVLWEALDEAEVTILYSTHVLSDVSRLADEIAFLVDGQLILRSAKEDLVDGWGRIGFQSAQVPESIPEAFSLRSDGSRHQVLSRDTKISARWLAQAGATHVEVARMTLDEIAVEIIKQGEQSWSA